MSEMTENEQERLCIILGIVFFLLLVLGYFMYAETHNVGWLIFVFVIMFPFAFIIGIGNTLEEKEDE
jgi:hypothetical protein